jgi:transcription-repair coupling factor (superfamily II helicase)
VINISSILWKFFPKIHTLPASKKKRFFSTFGLSNPSAKAFFLADYALRTQPHHIYFLVEKRSEIFEYQNLLSAFVGEEYDIFSFSLEENEDLQKREKFLFAQKCTGKKKTIFLLNRAQAEALYPHPNTLKKREVILKQNDKIKFTELFQHFSDLGYVSAIDEHHLEEGEFIRKGDTLTIFPLGENAPYVIETEFDEIVEIRNSSQRGDHLEDKNILRVFPVGKEEIESPIGDITTEKDLFFIEEFTDLEEKFQKNLLDSPTRIVENSAFPQNEEEAIHLRYLSILKFYTLGDFLNDIKEKINTKWKIFILSKRPQELETIFQEYHIPFTTKGDETASVCLFNAEELEFIPPSFQNTEEKILFLTDREIFHTKNTEAKEKKSRKKSENKSNAQEGAEKESGDETSSGDMMSFLTSLKAGDYVVHSDNGIGRFLGISEQKISDITREYLEIEYLNNDKLFVPIEYADKVSRYITEEDSTPRLTRLGGAEWKNTQKKAKKETEAIAKELLNIYAIRAKSHAMQCNPDTARGREFDESFPYAETPGQMAAIRDLKKDLESDKPMDRLVCGDVGFGKTEVAMRAAFKAVDNGMQVAVIAPITILVDQHYKNFSARMKDFGVRVEMISRFRSPKEQKIILEDLKKGKIDILIGTHRLLSEDVKFDNLGLLIIDEEQRFGVKQKEKLKGLRKDIHILTMTATPIPRTLNLALHKLREISTITTPPPGRLPVITEVRKYSDKLIRDAILQELERGGQTYFLHNRVETIEGIAEKLRHLVPEAKFEVAHGQLNPHVLEQKIIDFKAKKFDVLISSTIIENGIDLANANTMIINHADKFGLSQLYQLRGRIGRSDKQAYAYLMYSSQKLPLDAKKRLRAIVEASELGSGFQLSMRDLEIRGAGDVLGVSQHGSVNSVGVNHFLKLLRKTIKQMEQETKNKAQGLSTQEQQEEEELLLENIQIEIPINAFIPSFYIPDNKEKILMYQRLARSDNFKMLEELGQELSDEYGKMPKEVRNLIKILEIKLKAKKANLKSIRFQGQTVDITMSSRVTAKEIMNLLKEQNFWTISGNVLKTEPKNLGLDFVMTIEKALELLVKKG